MKVFGKIKDEKGFALVLSLVVMAGMAVLAITIFTTSTTDMYIARNEKEAKMAFYLAEAGIEEAIGRMDLCTGAGCDAAGRYIGETSKQKQDRRTSPGHSHPTNDGAGTGTATLDNIVTNLSATKYGLENFDSSFVAGLGDIGGSYTVYINYAIEAVDTWCDDDHNPTDDVADCNNEIVMYGQDFGFSGTGVPPIGYAPVYEIESEGTTTSGTAATIRAYVTSSGLNVIPPNNTIMFVEGSIYIGNNVPVNGEIASWEGDNLSTVFGCSSSATEHCLDRSSTIGAGEWSFNNMDTYLGITLPQISSYADHTYAQSGSNTVTYNVNDGDWGKMCSTLEDDDLSNHVCGNEAELIFIDNAGAGDAKISASGKGRGVLVVTGDLEVTSDFVWEGMVYVMGTLKVNGTTTMYGTFMVDGDEDTGGTENDVKVNGGLTIRGSLDVAASVGDMVGVPKVLRWSRR